ncbi:glycosyltransferase family 4 protein [Pseudomonas schmalbachii]|uniref:Glycosyltransferase family 4 protein n=1 Tax=Pseudomonas schmalbachii TaxID=2816993 RepID=A0ABS3TVK4_9PSED|nr:glycosyltransferase family 1 protein [Pseudomonas schmalbachii]MBO3277153.1 glycosyltransferase family 4 protein [Pseudomonas schmalbachii]
MEVHFPERIIDRHVGGNTTYTRKISQGLQARGVNVRRIPAGRSPYSTIFYESLYGLRKFSKDTILHYSADTGPLFKTRSKSIVTVHGVASRWINVARTSTQEYIWRRRVGLAIKSTNNIITVSNSSADDIAEIFGVDRKSIKVIHHGIDTDVFSQKTQLSENIAKILPSQYVLYLGNLEPRKNIIPLIDAFRSPDLRALNIPLVIAGRPAWNYKEILKAINNSKNVIYLGFVDDSDRVALMQNSSLFAFPSLYEGFGFPILEALAAGTVVITSRKGSLAEVSGPSLAFQELDSGSIASGIHDALTNNKERLNCIKNAPDWVSKFSWNSSIDKHIETYKELINS